MRRLYVPLTLLALICSLVALLALKLPPHPAAGSVSRHHTVADATTQEIAFVGDSITYGYYASDIPHRYATLAAGQINLPAWVDGTPGITAVAEAADFAAVPSSETVVPADSRVVVIELGTNDVRDVTLGTETMQQFSSAYSAILSRLSHDVPNAALVCLGTWRPPTVGVTESGAPFDSIIESLCPPQHYAALGDLYADNDYHGPAGVATYFGTSDTFHPNDLGHAAIANRVATLVSFILNGGAIIS